MRHLLLILMLIVCVWGCATNEPIPVLKDDDPDLMKDVPSFKIHRDDWCTIYRFEDDSYALASLRGIAVSGPIRVKGDANWKCLKAMDDSNFYKMIHNECDRLHKKHIEQSEIDLKRKMLK